MHGTNPMFIKLESCYKKDEGSPMRKFRKTRTYAEMPCHKKQLIRDNSLEDKSLPVPVFTNNMRSMPVPVFTNNMRQLAYKKSKNCFNQVRKIPKQNLERANSASTGLDLGESYFVCKPIAVQKNRVPPRNKNNF